MTACKSKTYSKTSTRYSTFEGNYHRGTAQKRYKNCIFSACTGTMSVMPIPRDEKAGDKESYISATSDYCGNSVFVYKREK